MLLTIINSATYLKIWIIGSHNKEFHWLSYYKVLEKFYLLRQEIIMFLEKKSQNPDEIKDESKFQDLAFAVDITEQLNGVNLKL